MLLTGLSRSQKEARHSGNQPGFRALRALGAVQRVDRATFIDVITRVGQLVLSFLTVSPWQHFLQS
jgi:hypothetical protein